MITHVTRAGIYVRQSSDRSGEGAAVNRQLNDCKAMCADRGWTVAGIYRDNDVSAYRSKRRPEYERMLADLRDGLINVIVCYHLDRLVRRVIDLESVIDLNVPVVAVNGEMDLANDSGRVLARILVAIAMGEVERKSARHKRANVAKAASGRPPSAGGLVPFGYQADLVTINREQAKAVRRAHKQVLAGATLSSVAREWNDQGFRTSRDAAWSPRTVRLCLLRARNAGLRSHLGTVVGKADWKGLVTEQVWNDTVRLLEDPKRRTTSGSARKYPLSGLARCGFVTGPASICGLRVMTGQTTAGARTYVCPKKHLSRSATKIDSFIRDLVIARLSRDDAPDLLIEEPGPDADDLLAEALALRSRQDEIARDFGSLGMSASQFRAANEAVVTELARIESLTQYSDRGDVLRDLVTAPSVADAYDELEVSRRRAVVSTLLTITLHPSGRGSRNFVPSTVGIDWI